MLIPLLIFDFDGTLARTFPLAMEIFNRLAAVHNLIPIDDFEEARTQPTKVFFKAHGIRIWKLGKFVKGFQEQMQSRASEIEAVTGLPEVLHELKSRGYRLGILSSNAEAHIRERLSAFDLGECFEFVSSYPKLFGKAKMLKKIAKQLGLNRTDIAYIGDELRDMEAARKGGFHSVGVTWGYHAESLLAESSPQHIARSPGDLLQIFAADIRPKRDTA